MLIFIHMYFTLTSWTDNSKNREKLKATEKIAIEETNIFPWHNSTSCIWKQNYQTYVHILKHNHEDWFCQGLQDTLSVPILPWRCAAGRLLPCPRPRPRWCTRSQSGRCGWGAPARGWSAAAAGTDNTAQCTVKHHTDIINFACMMWNFVRISASLSALCTNFNWFDIGIAFLAKFYPILM